MSEKSEKRTVKDIDHTHPHTDEPFGSRGVYDRGKSPDPEADRVEADPDDGAGTDRVPDDRERRATGGSGDRGAADGRRTDGKRRVKDIDHTPPDEVGAQRTFHRGEETPVPDRRSGDEDDDAV